MRRIRVTRVSLVAGLYLVAATAPRVASFLLLPIYAFELSPEELAAYGVAVAVVQLVGFISDAGILGGLGLTYWQQPEVRRAQYLKSVILLSRVVALVVLVPVGALLALIWEPLFGSGLPRVEGLALILAFAYLQRGNNLAGAVYRARKQHREFTLTKVLPAVVQIVAGTLMVFVLHWGSLGAVGAAPLGFLASIVLVGLRGRGGERVPFARLRVRECFALAALGLPLLPQQIALWAQMLSLRPLMAVLTNARETAEFTFASAPAQIVSPFSEAYEQYIAPRYYESATAKDVPVIGRLREITSVFMALGSMGTIAAIVLFDPLFIAFAPEAYSGTAALAAIGLAGMALRGPMLLLVHNLRVEDRRIALVGSVLAGTVVGFAQFFLLAKTVGAASAAWVIYLYPAVASLVALAVLRDRDLRLVSARDFLVTGVGVLAVLLLMVELRAMTGDDEVLHHYWVLVVVALVVVAIVGAVVVRPRLTTTLAVVRGGVTRPDHQPPGPSTSG